MYFTEIERLTTGYVRKDIRINRITGYYMDMSGILKYTGDGHVTLATSSLYEGTCRIAQKLF